jgi:signal transduction histidine kinase
MIPRETPAVPRAPVTARAGSVPPIDERMGGPGRGHPAIPSGAAVAVTLLAGSAAALAWPQMSRPALSASLIAIAALIAVATWFVRRRQIIAGISAVRDIVRLRKSEAAIRESESRMAALLEEAPAMIAVVRGPNHVFELANAGYRRLVGGREVVGKPVAEAVPELLEQGVIDTLDQVLATRQPFIGTEVLVRFARAPVSAPTDGPDDAGLEEHFIDFVYQPIIDHDGSAVGVFAHGVDVTAQVHARGEIEAAREAAEAASSAKSQFLAVMSHELRTPLNAILGYTELMEMGIAGPVTADQLDYHARVRGSSQHLLSLINELLDLSKIEAGHMRVSPEPVSLSRAIQSALQLIRPQAAARVISLIESERRGDELPALGDEARIRQVLLNLLSNAVKFTPPNGSVAIEAGESHSAPIVSATVAVATRPPGASSRASIPRWVFVRVSDTGSGIPADMLDTIFQPFVQLGGGPESIYRRIQGGTGLGLTISRRLARLMRGDVTVESEVGHGSTFTLWLPAAPERVDPSTVRTIRAELGRLLGASVGEIVATLASRVRDDPAIPLAREMSQTELEDHIAGYLADFAQQLVILDDRSTVERTSLVRDGIEIRRVVAERHGAQRARFGWSEHALNRELDLLQSETDAAARRCLRHLPVSEVEDVTALVRVFLREARGAAVDGYRRALGSEADDADDADAVRLDGAARTP